MTEIITAICSGAGALVGALSGARLTAYRIKILEKRVNAHAEKIDEIPPLKVHVSNLEREVFGKEV